MAHFHKENIKFSLDSFKIKIKSLGVLNQFQHFLKYKQEEGEGGIP